METENTQPKRITIKSKIILVILLAVIGASVYGYYWFSGVLKRDAESRAVIMNAEKYISIKRLVNDEYSRCQEFIIQERGDFGSFQYCKKFIDWVNSKNLFTK